MLSGSGIPIFDFLSPSKVSIFEKYSFEITINRNPVFYNVVEDVAYYYLSEENANQYVDLNIKIASKDKFKYAVTSGNYDKEKGFYVDFEKPIDLIIYNDEAYYGILRQVPFCSYCRYFRW